MQRRDFLKTTVIVASASSVYGCGDDGSDTGGDGPMGIPAPELEGRTLTSADDDGYDVAAYFPQSVASGDPRPGSVLLWTRAVDAAADGALRVVLQVATDEEFTQRVDLGDATSLEATADADGCIRVRIEGLDAGTTYYYRFVYLQGEDGALSSRVGRTRTAPAADADVPVRFAVASCQDYGGKYYHSYKHMAEQDLDFVVHLGDYIYETAGDPSFQAMAGERSILFEDQDGALALDQGAGSFFAARSLDNYRQLYRDVRADRDLQRIHELFPMIVVWDDHEFSDDCHGETGTYKDGTEDEFDGERRANADRAWFEYMPVDYADPTFQFAAGNFPDNLTIYRDFVYGQNLHLVMTDLRRYRDDHLVPEDAFPGAVAATQEQLMAALGEIPEVAVAYVDLDDAAYADHKAYLNAAAAELEMVDGDFAGLVDLEFINDQLAAATADNKPEAIEAPDALRGISYQRLFKTSRFSNVGSRYVVRTRAYDALSRVRWAESNGASEQAMGDTQERWFVDTLTGSNSTWKVWGNEFTFTQRFVDLSEVEAAAFLGLQDLLSMSAEDWDGMPSRREKLLDEVGGVDNLVAVTGDIHAFFTGVQRSAADPEKGLVEFVSGAISSSSFKELLVAVATGISPLATPLAESAEDLLRAANPQLAQFNLVDNGYGLFQATSDRLDATYFTIAADEVKQAELSDLDGAFTATSFFVKAGDKTLWRQQSGSEQRWDEATGAWV